VRIDVEPRGDSLEALDLIRDSGNVFRDLGFPAPAILQLKTILAAGVIAAMDREGLTVREAQRRTGIDAADFSRIRNADFRRMSIERLLTINSRLGLRVELKVRVKPPRVAKRTPRV